MAEKVVTTRICDVCRNEHSKESKAIDARFEVRGSEGKMALDLCLNHANRYGLYQGSPRLRGRKGASEATTRSTRTTSRSGRTTRRRNDRRGAMLQCPFCTEEKKGGQGLSAHVRQRHPENYEEFRLMVESDRQKRREGSEGPFAILTVAQARAADKAAAEQDLVDA